MTGWVRARPVVATVIAVVAVHAVLDVWWLLRFRHPFLGTIDETQFLTAAWADGQALGHGHPHALWDSFQSFTWFAPLLPLLTAPILAVHDSPVAAILVELPLLALMLAATGVIAQRIGGRRVAVLSVICVAAAPVVIDESRDYSLALISAAMLTSAIAALMLSNGLRNTRWSLVFGLCVGLTALSRLMMLALLPPVIVAAVLLAFGSEERAVRLRNLGAAAGVALVVAAPWYGPHLSGVMHYLTNDGYGAAAADYGTSHGVLTWQFWTAKASLTARGFLDLPLTIVVLLAVAVGLVAVAQRVRRHRGDGALRTWAREHADLLLVTGVLVAGYLMLTSSTNEGNDFELPLIPPLLVLSVFLLMRIATRWWRAAVAATVVAIAGANLAVSTVDASVGPAVSMPVLGDVPVVARAEFVTTINVYLAAADPQWWGRSAAAHRAAWESLPAQAVARLSRLALDHGRRPVVWFGVHDRVLNFSQVTIACLYGQGRQPLWMGVLDSTTGGDDATAYATQLQPANLLVTGPPGPGDFRPIPTETTVEAAARASGFAPAFDIDLPDGRADHVWWRDSGPPAPPADTVCGA
jgi:4-amino-4-deoxy-L-arabinose transferase-like glycosyltransferase